MLLNYNKLNLTGAWSGQLLTKHLSAEWEIMGPNPGWTNSQGRKISEENLLPLFDIYKMVRHSSLLS